MYKWNNLNKTILILFKNLSGINLAYEIKNTLFVIRDKIKTIFSIHLINFCLHATFLLLVFSISKIEAAQNTSMQEDLNPSQSKGVALVVGVEGMEKIKKREAIIKFFPHVACLHPRLSSPAEYRIALEFIDTTQFIINSCQYASFSKSIRRQGHNLTEEALQYLNFLTSYVDHLKNFYTPPFVSLLEKQKLQSTYYNLLQSKALCYLQEIVINSDEEVRKRYREEFQKTRRILEEDKSSSIQLKQAMQTLEVAFPNLPHLLKGSQPSPVQVKLLPLRQVIQEDIKYQQRVLSSLPQEYDEKFPEFRLSRKFREILTHFNVISLRDNSEERKVAYQECGLSCLGLEKEIYNYIAEITKTSKEDCLTYAHLLKLYTTPSPTVLDPQDLGLLDFSLNLYLWAGMYSEAKLRLKVVESILLEKHKGILPLDFINFRARILVLSGDLVEWLKLEEAKQSKRQQEELDQKIKSLKKEPDTNEEESVNPLPQNLAPDPSIKDNKLLKELSSSSPPLPQPENSALTTTADTKQTAKKQDISSPFQQGKVHKGSSLSPKGLGNKDKDKPGKASSVTPSPLKAEQKHYYIANSAFKTYRKLQNHQLKIKREKVYNLFKELGCQIDERKGKGSHGKISFPQETVIKHNQNIVSVFPYMKGESSINLQKTPESMDILISTDWENKAGGIIPAYLTKSIFKAFENLGVNDNTVHKKNNSNSKG